jgi:hypothetical protein
MKYYLSINLVSCIISGRYFKHMMIVNDDSSIVSEQSSLLIDNARGVIYDRRMFIIRATGIANAW